MKKILIAEDDDGLRSMMATWLKRIPGVQIITAGDGTQALHSVHSANFDIVISDLNMPGMNGADLLRAIGAMSEPRPRVYILSGMGAYGPEDLTKLGAHGVFEKTQVSAMLKLIKDELTIAA